MPDLDTLALLKEALDFFNDHPNFGLRRDRRATTYALAARIEAHLAALAAPAPIHPAIAIARDRWSRDGLVEIDEREHEVSEGTDGVWVRAWVLVPSRDLAPDDDQAADEDIRERYREVLSDLPDATRKIFLLHRVDGLDYKAIATTCGIAVADVERHIAAAILTLTRALDG